MRTTLAIDDDILEAARAIARQKESTVGAVISELARRALGRPEPTLSRNGIALLPTRPNSSPVTLETVNALRDDIP